MPLIAPNARATDEYNRLLIKHLKVRTQLLEAAVILMTLLVFVAFALAVFGLGWLMVWIVS